MDFKKGDKVMGRRWVKGRPVGKVIPGEVTCAGPKAFTIRWSGDHIYWNCFKQANPPPLATTRRQDI